MELPLQQHPSFGAALKTLGADVKRVDIKGAAPTQVIKRFGINFAPRGPVWTTEDAAALRQSPLWMVNAERSSDIYRTAGFRQLMTPAHVAELNLRNRNWLAQARGKWRNAWRKSQRFNLKLRDAHFDAVRHGWLLTEDLKQQRRKKFRAMPHAIIHAYGAIDPRNVVVFSAKANNRDIAAMLFLRHGMVATYHLGWSSAEGRATNAHYALLEHAAECLATQGVTRLDLGLVDTENTPGLARFKIGSGAQVRPLGGTWLRIPGL
ncbi:MAG: GNAT family N-acetyltransferase [Pseudomonadota bacterium]